MLSSGALSATPQHFAVVGGGLGGLAVAFHLSHRSGCSVDVFDSRTPGSGGASPLASLMHPHSPRGKLIWRGREGVAASLELMGFAERFCGENESVFFCKGRAIRRPCLTPEHLSMFEQAAQSLPELITLGQDAYSTYGSAALHCSYVINTPLYLRALTRGLHRDLGVRIIEKSVAKDDLDALRRDYDHVTVCAGAGLPDLVPGVSSRVTLVRGQNIIFKSETSHPLDEARICGEYVVPIGDGMILCGATHEYSEAELHSPPNLDLALQTLSPSLQKIYPPLKSCTPLRAAAGIRVAAPRTHLGKVPLIGRHPEFENVSFLTGFGSHGLVHHALLAKMLVDSVFSDGFDSLPPEVRFL